MHRLTHLTRRGAVYYWRGRLELAEGRSKIRCHRWVSLRTRDPKVARRRAARMTAAIEEAKVARPEGIIPTEALAEITRAVVADDVDHFAMIATSDRTRWNHDPTYEAKVDRRTAAAFQLIAQFGPNTHLAFDGSCPVRRQLAEAGFDDEDIDRIADIYGQERWVSSMDARRKIKRELTRLGAELSPVNRELIRSAIYRGKAEALMRTAEAREAIRLPQALHANASRDDPEGDLAPVREPVAKSDAASGARAVRSEELPTLITAFAKEKVQGERWRPNARNHCVATLQLFKSFMEMENLATTEAVGQAEVARFKGLLNDLPTHYAKSARLRSLPLALLIAATESVPEKDRGVSAKTLRRHLGDLSQFWRYLKAQGVAVQEIDFAGIKPAKPRRRAADEAPKWSPQRLERLFQHPVFIGHAPEVDRSTPGSVLLRDGIFFVPLMAILCGLRREEAAGLRADDFDEGDGIAFFRVAPNDIRGVKTLKSERLVPVHDELIRLGLLNLVEERRRAGAALLFPELKRARTPMGDRVFDQLVRLFSKTEGFEDLLIARPIHGLRHDCNVRMKFAGVASEIRDDVLGKEGLKETEARYSQVAPLNILREAIHKPASPVAHIPGAPKAAAR